MPASGPSSWTVADVAEWLQHELEMPAILVDSFKDNAVSGPGESRGAAGLGARVRACCRLPSAAAPLPQRCCRSSSDHLAEVRGVTWPAPVRSCLLPPASGRCILHRPTSQISSIPSACIPHVSDLLELSDEDLIEALGCKPLQARKVSSSRRRRSGEAWGTLCTRL